MSWHRKEEWGSIVSPNDNTKKIVVLYSIYDIQEFNMAKDNGEDYEGEIIHWASQEMEPDVAEDLVEFLYAYKKELINQTQTEKIFGDE